MYFYIFAFYYWCKFFNLQNFRFEIFSCKAPWAYGYGAIEILIIIILSNALHNTWTRTAQFAWVWRYIPPPPKKKFKLLYATLLFWINARFANPIFDFYNSTLYIHYSTFMSQNPIFNFFNSTLRIDSSTSIFQILFTCNIRLCVLSV